MMMDEKLVNRRMIMDKKILAGDEDGWISCSMVKYYFPSNERQQRLPKLHLSNLSCKNPPTSSHSHYLGPLITTTYVIE
jgi:hypothetical protein